MTSSPSFSVNGLFCSDLYYCIRIDVQSVDNLGLFFHASTSSDVKVTHKMSIVSIVLYCMFTKVFLARYIYIYVYVCLENYI